MVTTQINRKPVKQLSAMGVAFTGLDNVLATLGHVPDILRCKVNRHGYPVPPPVPQELLEGYLHPEFDAQGSPGSFLWVMSTLATPFAV